MSSGPHVEKSSEPSGVWLLLILLLVVLAGVWWKSVEDKAGCQLNVRNVQQASRSYCGMNGLNPGSPLLRTDLIGPGGLIGSEPVCPAGGTYTWSSVHPACGDLAIRCSNRKHQLDPALIADW